MSAHGFKEILLGVCEKTASNGKILNSRLLDLWKGMEPYGAELHPIRSLVISRLKFAEGGEHAVKVLEECEAAMVDTYWAIKMVATALFHTVPDKMMAVLPSVFKGADDVGRYELAVAGRLVNSLLEFFKLEKELISPGLYLYGKTATFLRVKKRMPVDTLVAMVSKDGIEMTREGVLEILERWEELGLLTLDGAEAIHVAKALLSDEQQALVEKSLFPLVEWSINAWRTMFNVRELNTPIPNDYPDHEGLAHVVSHAATQGFTHAHFVFQELKKYVMVHGLPD